MEDQLVSFETAKLAKKKGFNLKIGNYFRIGGLSNGVIEEVLEVKQDLNKVFPDKPIFSRPTQSLLQKWLREVHKIYVSSYHDLNPKQDGIIYYTNWGFINDPSDKKLAYNPLGGYDESSSWKTYEEALEFGLQESLKLI